MEFEAILTAVELASHIASVTESAAATPTGLAEKARWQTVTVVNRTQFMLVPSATYFASGRFWTAPAAVPPFQKVTFSVCNSDFSFFTGATGATVMQMVTGTAGKNFCNLGIAFGAPWIGDFQTNTAFDPDPSVTGADPAPRGAPGDLAHAVADAWTTSTVNVRSASFSGTDTAGKPTTIVFNAVAVPGQEAVVSVTQQVTDGGS